MHRRGNAVQLADRNQVASVRQLLRGTEGHLPGGVPAAARFTATSLSTARRLALRRGVVC